VNKLNFCYLYALVLGLAAVGGCSKDSSSSSQPAASQGDEATPPEAMTQGTAALNDDQIMAILDSVDTGEIEQAQIATTKASDPRVRDFATQMITEHTKSKQKGAQLASQLGITPTASHYSQELQTKGSKMLEKVRAADSTKFDSIYMKGQIQQHQEVLNLLSDKLLPAASDAQLRQMLVEAQTMVQHHLDEAKQIQM
jgi:putative membrane protein